MRALEFITGHVIFKLCYNQIYQLKTTKQLIQHEEKYILLEDFLFHSMYMLKEEIQIVFSPRLIL